jgi:hypothetical protein
LNEIPEDWLEVLKTEYPRRHGGNGWHALKKIVPARLSEGFTWEDILNGTRSYKKYCIRTGIAGTIYVKQARTFFGPDCWFDEDYDEPVKEVVYRQPEQQTEEQRRIDAEKAKEQFRKYGIKGV